MLKTCFATMVLAVSLQAAADESGYPTNQCIDSLNHDIRLFAIVDKVALARSNETGDDMLRLDRPASTPEHRALELWSKLRQFCFDLGAEFRRERVEPEQAALATRLFDLHQGLIGELRAGQLTYAEFNGRRVDIYAVASSLEAQMIENAPVEAVRKTGI